MIIIYLKFLRKRCWINSSDPNSHYEREWVMPHSSHSDTSFYVELGDKMACMESHHSPQHILDSQQTFIRFKLNCSKTFYPGSSCPFRMPSDALHSSNLVSLVRTMQAFVGLINNISKSWVLGEDFHYSRISGPLATKWAVPDWEPKPRSHLPALGIFLPFTLPVTTPHALQHASLWFYLFFFSSYFSSCDVVFL